MAERNGGGSSPWLAFIAGILLVAVVAFGVVAYTGGFNQERTAELDLTMPEVNPPDIDLPDAPPAPALPPSAEAPVEAPSN